MLLMICFSVFCVGLLLMVVCDMLGNCVVEWLF